MSGHDPEWTLVEHGFDRARAGYRETVFTVGNGRLGTRGSLEEGHLGALSGTYLAGVYDAHDSPVIDLVNAPDWLHTAVWVDGVRLDPDAAEIVEHERVLDLRTGLLHRSTTFADRAGRCTRLRSVRLASMADRDLCALRVEVTPLGHDAEVVVVAGVDGHRRNLDRLPRYPDGLDLPPQRRWDKWARSTHLDVRELGFAADGTGFLHADTIDRGTRLAFAFAVTAGRAADRSTDLVEGERVARRLEFRVPDGETVTVDKLVGIATSRDPGRPDDPGARAAATVAAHAAGGVDGAVRASTEAWAELWRDSELQVVGHEKDALALRFGTYHLLIAANPDDPTVSIGAKSLSGEGYRGHVFWDSEILLLPFYLYTRPETARSLLCYRHHTLPGARALSAENGTRGARYAWEAADTGREECPRWTPDGKDRFWTREEELHVTADVAYAVREYVAVTGDERFLLDAGAEILFETARFWVSRLEERADGSLGLSNVMGPDEFHSHVAENAFTNRLVRWHLTEAVDVHRTLAATAPDRLAGIGDAIGLDPDEVAGWADVADRVRRPVARPDGVIEQFDGYFDRLDVPIESWDENDMPRYPPGYHHFNCEDTKLLKQPDVLMLMYLLPDEYPPETQRANFEYYEARTLHKSSLSPSIHAILGLQVGDPTMAVRYFERSAYVDLDDNQGNTIEGMHIAAAAGTWQIAVHGFGGMRMLGGRLTFAPRLPERWERLRFTVRWRGHPVRVDLGHDESSFVLDASPGTTQGILVDGAEVLLVAGDPVTVPTKH
ncbi:glycoside hydrolase family 65 protein [Pseudonocardia sp. C8]|uniref:glycoside hydrolase family 65 protein n=1 Tax=Pseudonocardia sp. C8 TaxID=2762759 RepID=UPI001642C8A5|nr:glycoside hydrolase family 65 protein [Pseudonocardia sp. C8]MBC3194751.1 glycoside hydrolase family 65 protein [Pseudonocardia sp. C8]